MNNLLSFSSVKLDRFARDGTRLKSASGFLLEADNRYYLITNLHVISGMDKESSLEPYLLKTFIHSHWGEDEKSFPFSMGRRQRITVQLYDDPGVPIWKECRRKGASEPPADIAALLLQLSSLSTSLMALRPFKDEPLPNLLGRNYWSKVSAIPISAIDTDVDYDPPDPVHVIGYPHSWAPEGTDRTSSAFWRTSFIASEIYEAGMSRSDVFIIDPCAPEGMTGSPVVGMKKDRMKLLGVYSDRSTAVFGADAGFVYDARLLKELVGHFHE